MTRFYKTDPNRTSGKIKLTPPVDSYTIILVVLTLSTTQTTQGWFSQMSFLGDVESSNAWWFLALWRAWLGKNQWFTGKWPDNVGQTFSVDFATYQPLRSQHSPVILCLDSNHGLPPFSESIFFPTPPPPFVSIRDTTSFVKLLRLSILFGRKLCYKYWKW